MINLLRKLFIKDYQNVSNEKVRIAHAILAALIGIISNSLLFILKLLIGIFTFSISIIADSINNLSDMASSIVTLLGFHFAGKPADKEHPYGHERIEYVTGLIVALIIFFIGTLLGYTSILKIINYKEEIISDKLQYISIGILSFAIIVKILQCLSYLKISKIISSNSLKATAFDSLFDIISTSIILISTIVIFVLTRNNISIKFSIDGILGVLVSLFIIISGVLLIKEQVNPLIGEPISKEYIDEIVNYVKSFDDVLGVHDVICHKYGPTICYIILHLELDNKLTFEEAHSIVDKIEMIVRKKYNVDLTIHMDPKDNSKEYNDILKYVEEALSKINKNIELHDLRLINSKIKTITFDVIVDYDFDIEKKELEEKVEKELFALTSTNYNVIIKIDHNMINDEK